MAENRNSGGQDCGSNFKRMLSDMGLLKQSVDKSVKRTDDVLRKYNTAVQSEDSKAQAEVLALTKKSATATSNSATKEDVSKAVSAASQNTAKRLDELFGKSASSSVAKTSAPSKASEVAKSATSAKVTSKGESKSDKGGHAKTQERLEQLFGDAKTRSNQSAARLDELFGKANTKLEGVDNSINTSRESILKKMSPNFGEMILRLIMSPPGLLAISFVAGFIKGWVETQPWFQFVKGLFLDVKDFITSKVFPFLKNDLWPFLKDTVIPFIKEKVLPLVKKIWGSKIGKALIGGGIIALLLNKLTGGLIGVVAKPLLGLLGKGLGALLTKGIPMLLKGGLGLVKGLAGFLTNPVGAGIAAFAAGAAIGYAGFKAISNKLQEMREEETKKINENASNFASNEDNKKQNADQLAKLKAGDGNEQYMQVSNGKGGFETVKGHFDKDGNFVVAEQMDSSGSFKAVEPGTVTIKAADAQKKTKKMSFNWIAQSKKGITRVQFGQIEQGVRVAFMKYVDVNYCQTGELPPKTSTKLMSALKIMSAHYSVEGEGLNNDDGEAGLKKQLAETWATLNSVVQSYEPGFSPLSQFVKNYKIVYGKIVGYMVPKANRGAIMAAVQDEKFLFEKNYLQSDDWNHIAFAATVYQIWLDIFLGFINKEFKTDFKSNTITKAEYDEAMGKDKGVQSQALALSTSLATQVRTDNADNKKREAVKIAAAKKSAAKAKASANGVAKVVGPDGKTTYRYSDGSEASPEDVEKYKKEHGEYDKEPFPGSQSLTKADLAGLYQKIDEVNRNSKAAADNSKRAEQAGTAAAVTSAKFASKQTKGTGGPVADGAKVKSGR